jgi:hypothetical protein
MIPSPVPKSSRMERLLQLPGWWTGAAEARRQLAEQAASDKERDQHHTAIAEYERRATAAGRIA